MENYREDFEAWFLSLDSDFTDENLARCDHGNKYFYITIQALYEQYCELREIKEAMFQFRDNPITANKYSMLELI